MIEALFFFSGRMGRLAYLGWNVVALVLMAVGAFATGIFGAFSLGPGGAGSAGFVAMMVPVFVFAVWISVALMVKRLRDMGFAPWIWTVGFVVVIVVDQFLLSHYIRARFIPPFQDQTPIGGFVLTAFTILLLLWPPADDAEELPAAVDRRFNRI